MEGAKVRFAPSLYFGRESQDACATECIKKLPCDSVCTRHKHVQSRVWADAEGSSILGRCFTDHPVKHCAVLMKMVIIIKNVFGRYKRERLGITCLSRAKVAFQILLNAQGGIYLQQHQEVTHQGNMK